MAAVLVTGGTGTLGRHLVPALRGAGHHVRVLSRTTGPDVVTGDLTTGAGLSAALDGMDVVVHAATDPVRARRVEVSGTTRLLDAAAMETIVSRGRWVTALELKGPTARRAGRS